MFKISFQIYEVNFVYCFSFFLLVYKQLVIVYDLVDLKTELVWSRKVLLVYIQYRYSFIVL